LQSRRYRKLFNNVLGSTSQSIWKSSRFLGLFFGGMFPEIQIPNIVFLLGLTIFVYTIGLSNGRAFFKNIKRNGVRDLLFIVGMLTFSGGITAAVHYIFGFSSALSAGLFAGSTTNTPALAGLLDTIQKKSDSGLVDLMQQEAVIGYSLSYPMGVIGVMIAIGLMRSWLKIDFKKEAKELARDYPSGQEVNSNSVKIDKLEKAGITLRDLMKANNWKIVFGRLSKNDRVFLPDWDTTLENGDILTLAGSEEDLELVAKSLGEIIPNKLSEDSSVYQNSRIFVSNPNIAGKTIASLTPRENFSAIITSVRRGDKAVIAAARTCCSKRRH